MEFNATGNLIQWNSIFIAFLFLLIGSIEDFRKREVSDRLWLIFAPIGATLTGAHLFLDPSLWFLSLVSMGASSLIAVLLAYSGLYGGADAKALICLALTVPLVPENITPLIGHLHPIFPLTVLYNAYLIALVPIIVILIRNLREFLVSGRRIFERHEQESAFRKIVLMFTGYRVSLASLSQSIHLFPLEQPGDDTDHRVGLKLFVSAESDRQNQISRLARVLPEDSKVWATPGLPLLIFIAAGYGVVLFVGDFLMWAVLAAFGAI